MEPQKLTMLQINLSESKGVSDGTGKSVISHEFDSTISRESEGK
jgi:hypothetical protein